MAKKSPPDKSDTTAPDTQGPGLLMALVVSLIVGAAAGTGYGFLMPKNATGASVTPPPSNTQEKGHEEKSALEAVGRFPKDAIEIAIPSIIATIGGEPSKNIRLDLSMIAIHGTAAETTLKSEIREDVIALLRGLKVEDLEGGRGFLNLRAQLDERARIRGRGAILGLLVGGLIIQ